MRIVKNIVFWGVIPGLVWYGFGFWKGFEVASSPQVRAILGANEIAKSFPDKFKEFFGGK